MRQSGQCAEDGQIGWATFAPTISSAGAGDYRSRPIDWPLGTTANGAERPATTSAIAGRRYQFAGPWERAAARRVPLGVSLAGRPAATGLDGVQLIPSCTLFARRACNLAPAKTNGDKNLSQARRARRRPICWPSFVLCPIEGEFADTRDNPRAISSNGHLARPIV